MRALIALLVLTSPKAMGQYSVYGIVNNTVSGNPIANALVTIFPQQTHAAVEKHTLSDPTGAFHFEVLAGGRYTLTAHRPDFQLTYPPDNSGEILVPRPSSEGPVQLHLIPYGTIQGKVVNQFGDPMEPVLVVVSSLRIVDGERTTAEIGSPWTNHRGEFLLTRVPPGQYYVKVLGRHGETKMHVGPEQTTYAPWQSFRTKYFNGGSDFRSAVPVEVEAGAIARVDFRVVLQPAFRIRGQLSGYHANDPVNLELLEDNEPAAEIPAVIDGATGRFELRDVLPGSYQLRATQGTLRAEIPLTLGESDLEGVSVTLLPPLTIQGASHLLTGVKDGSQAGSCAVSLNDPRFHQSALADAPAEGGFAVADVYPGEYRVTIRCFGGYPQFASFGNVDVFRTSAITIAPDEKRSLEIGFQPGGGTLHVKFSENILPQSRVLLVPCSPASGGPVLGMPPGEATFFDRAPGDYLVYAFRDELDVAYRSPTFLQSLLGGTPAHIEDGKTTEVVITRLSR